ncbi:MAG: DUF3034 family protein [Planctomycetes bacterium]|nr:DUF3034 family protein [Planctomycetota bacterium]
MLRSVLRFFVVAALCVLSSVVDGQEKGRRKKESITAESKKTTGETPKADKSAVETKTVGDKKTKKRKKGPPLPLFQLEGMGGIGLNPTAYVINPEPIDERGIFGLPAMGTTFVFHKNSGYDLTAVHVSETLFKRLELSYSHWNFQLGGYPTRIKGLTQRLGVPGGVDIRTRHIGVDVFNTKLMFLDENAWGIPYIPAMSFGISAKWNQDIHKIDRRLGGYLQAQGYRHDKSVDFVWTATKTITKLDIGKKNILPNPLLLTGGIRVSDGAQLGILGFTGRKQATFEGSIAYFLNDWIAIAAEYRGKPSTLRGDDDAAAGEPDLGLVANEDDWWDVAAAFVLSEDLTFSLAYAQLGDIGDVSANGAWYFQLKYEF